MLDVLNESSSSIPWKEDYLFTAEELKLMNCLKSGYCFSVLRFKASTMKVSLKPLLTRCDFVMMDVLNETGTKIPWKVDYLFTAVELKLKKCLKRGYWISVHRFKASTKKVSFNPLLTRCDFVMMDVLNESGTKIPWKVDYLFSTAVLKLKKCLKSGYWFSVLRFKASTMKVSLKPLLTRCDFVMMDVLNETGTKIPWKVDYLFTAVELKLKKCLKRRYSYSVLRYKSSSMKPSE